MMRGDGVHFISRKVVREAYRCPQCDSEINSCTEIDVFNHARDAHPDLAREGQGAHGVELSKENARLSTYVSGLLGPLP